MRALILVLVLTWLCGCVSSGAQPEMERCRGAQAFIVVKHDWHTSLVLNRESLLVYLPGLATLSSGGGYLEIGWGDERFYQSPGAGPLLALRAGLWPTRSILHVVSFRGSPEEYFSGQDMVRLSADRKGYSRLLTFVASSFERDPKGQPVRAGPGLYGNSEFFRAVGSFHLFNTCNTWIAKALARAGYPVSTSVVTANALWSELERLNRVGGACLAPAQ